DAMDAGDGGDPSDASDDANGGDAGEAGTHPDAGPDTGPPILACDPAMPFAEPVLVYGLNRSLGTDQKVSLSPDELTAYVAAGPRMGATHLSVATRTTTADP